jgi:hypothetical protein
MFMNRMSKKLTSKSPFLLTGIAIVGWAMLAAPPDAFSQSCALCYTQAASAGTRMIEALKSGILILIVPPTLMSVCMVFILKHKSTQYRHSDDELDADELDANTKW